MISYSLYQNFTNNKSLNPVLFNIYGYLTKTKNYKKSKKCQNLNDTKLKELGIEMKKIPFGTFLMGSPISEIGRDPDEVQHKVTLTEFYIGKTEITQKQWSDIMGANPSYFINCGEDCPVEQVSWYDAIIFCNKLSEFCGLDMAYNDKGELINSEGEITSNIEEVRGYRLPTESEWEYACRAGTTGAIYRGDWEIKSRYNNPILDPIAWYGGNSCVNYDGGYNRPMEGDYQYKCNKYGSQPVGGKLPNNYGLYDMVGNVWEWCYDWLGDYPVENVSNPLGQKKGKMKIFRGGCWDDFASYCRSAMRYHEFPSSRIEAIGFRVALSK